MTEGIERECRFLQGPFLLSASWHSGTTNNIQMASGAASLLPNHVEPALRGDSFADTFMS